VWTRELRRSEKVGCIENEEERERDKDRNVLGREKYALGSENDLYSRKTRYG
jgi:hypothetical protein